MAKTNLQIKSTNAATGAKMTTTLTYVNPEANSATLKQFAQKLNRLTTNNYVEADRVQSINVDTEQVINLKPGTLALKTNPTITQSGTNYSIALDQFLINGETLTTNEDYYLIFGYFVSYGGNVIPARLIYNATTLNINDVPEGRTNGKLKLALKPINNYSAAVMDQEINLAGQ